MPSKESHLLGWRTQRTLSFEPEQGCEYLCEKASIQPCNTIGIGIMLQHPVLIGLTKGIYLHWDTAGNRVGGVRRCPPLRVKLRGKSSLKKPIARETGYIAIQKRQEVFDRTAFRSRSTPARESTRPLVKELRILLKILCFVL